MWYPVLSSKSFSKFLMSAFVTLLSTPASSTTCVTGGGSCKMLDSLANEGDTEPNIRAEERPKAVKLVATFSAKFSLDGHDI